MIHLSFSPHKHAETNTLIRRSRCVLIFFKHTKTNTPNPPPSNCSPCKARRPSSAKQYGLPSRHPGRESCLASLPTYAVAHLRPPVSLSPYVRHFLAGEDSYRTEKWWRALWSLLTLHLLLPGSPLPPHTHVILLSL